MTTQIPPPTIDDLKAALYVHQKLLKDALWLLMPHSREPQVKSLCEAIQEVLPR